MKLNMKSPWVIVRWAAAGAIYLATVGIAVDQVRERDGKIAELEKTGAMLRRGMAGMAKATDQLIESSDRQGQQLKTVSQLRLDDAAKRLKEADELDLQLERLRVNLDSRLEREANRR